MRPVHELREPDLSLAGPWELTKDSAALAKKGDARNRGPGPSGGVSIHRAHSAGLSGAGRVASSHLLGSWPAPP